MPASSEFRRIAFVGDYVPRKCGIATFTHDVRHAVAGQFPHAECVVVPVDDVEGGYDYPPEVRFQIPDQDLEGYRRAAEYLNFGNFDVVCLQHEYGIFGGAAGSHVLALLRELRMPIVTTLHTVLRDPTADQKRVLEQLGRLSTRMVVMAERAKTFLREVYSVPEEKIDLIPHGIPDMPFVDPNFYKDQFGVEGQHVLLTFGLLSPNKGVEHAIQALPRILQEFPNTVYIVLGATHPHLVREQGETYRLGLQRLAKDLGVSQQVAFYSRFVELRELTEFIAAADIYITPYLNPAQITSGTLAYSFGCGKAVVSTPYWHAEELLAEERGVVVPFGDSDAIATAVCDLLRDETRRHAMRKRAYMLGREMIWSNVGHLYMDAFVRARHEYGQASRRPTRQTAGDRRLPLPDLRIEHLLRMTDSTGLFQHATYTIPNFREGYCTDDNARGLVLAVMLEEIGLDTADMRQASATYAAFLDFAFDTSTGRFRNFLGFDRRWLEKTGSDDSLGRAVWALGTCVGRSRRHTLQAWAMGLFERALIAASETDAVRTWAFTLLGIHEYLRRLSGDRFVQLVRDDLTRRMLERFQGVAAADWPWFEDLASYANAALPHALLLGGQTGNQPEAVEVALKSLRWICQVQKAPSGCFRPVGSHGFYPRGEQPAQFDQQPIEAHATVSAAIAAYKISEDSAWLDEAARAFEWFLGRNDIGQALVDARSGGCRDGLLEDRVNQNQGAESTLSYLLALAEMKLLESSLAAFDDRMAGQRQPLVGGNHQPLVAAS